MDILVTTKPSYYEKAEASWYPKHNIIEVDLGPPFRFARCHGAVLASNVDQIVFGLTPEGEIITIEAIGVRFQSEENLIAPLPNFKGNLAFASIDWNYGNKEDHETLTFDYGRQRLILTKNLENTLFRICFNDSDSTTIICPSPHLMYSVAGSSLQGLWIINPRRSRIT